MRKPRKQPEEKRTEAIQSFVTKKQREFVTSISADYGITESRYIQMLIESQIKSHASK